MKTIILMTIILSSSALSFASCPKKELWKQANAYHSETQSLPVVDDAGNVIGKSESKNFKVSNTLLSIDNKQYLLSSKDNQITYNDGKTRTIYAASLHLVDMENCKVKLGQTPAHLQTVLFDPSSY